MKKLFVLTAFLSFSFLAKSQNDRKLNFGIAGSISLPTGDLEKTQNYGVGFEGHLTYAITTNLHATFQTGIIVFQGKDLGFGSKAESVLHVPILVGARYYFGDFFAGAGVGYGTWTGSGNSYNGFTYSPQVGYRFNKIDVLANYTSSSVTGGTLSYFGLKVVRNF
jgi:hypothetical protein